MPPRSRLVEDDNQQNRPASGRTASRSTASPGGPTVASGVASGVARRVLVLARRAAWAWCAVLAVLTVAVGLLLVVTPSAGDAAQRARRMQQAAGVDRTVDRVPDRVAAAVLATEDHRFRQHFGLDLLALGRFALGAVQGRDDGGSTIELQLAKVLYTGDGHGPGQVRDRLGLALKLDSSYDKDQILLMYLNTVYFGHGYSGVADAASGYFGRSAYELDWPQAALLAGLLQAPDGYDPLLHPDTAMARRHHVLDRLRAVGAISAADAARYDRAPLGLAARS